MIFVLTCIAFGVGLLFIAIGTMLVLETLL